MDEHGTRVRPEVTLKWAQTIDGRVATTTGHSRWISGPEARILAHRLRAEHDAILVGVGTVLADNPQLTTRLVAGPDPLRVILDSRLRTPPGAAVVRSGTLIATRSDAPVDRERLLAERGAEVARTRAHSPHVDPRQVMALLSARAVRSVLVEGGPTLITTFLRARLADRVVVVLAPAISGSGMDAVGALGIDDIAGSIGFEAATFDRAHGDAIFHGRPIWPL